ncbi:DEAD/DEAH box helicase [Leadbettera azotonutricia]|uniref:ATP-dependent RNA helicase RhlB n=1 Tax=Leadbettera azotonutricia (strain ATCC BAA-888 / DSM 13862 / ZAS-9) TaxID=545695 RepID=F5YDS1_LEAAZ|nr:DEAD/DEAH box helicase [Leadbettera azotonutricia]AEF82782.1 ATP-dependent RNA helicase RhlB [Leadbettera azotonutricia ZAS-9]
MIHYMEFTELQLHPELQKGINEAGYITCMPVQEQVLANAFNGQDLYVQSQTGTGKTAAFLIVIFQRLLSESVINGKKAIIMVPTRELAVQVEEEAKVIGKYLPFKIGSFYGGVGYAQQQQALRDGAQILVGTPGRVLDLNQSGQMNLMDIAFLVIDEADRMFDMGFYPDLRKLIKVVPPADRRQTMLFSATLNAWVKNLAWEYTKTPFEIEIAPETVTVEEVEQVLYHVPSENKMRLLMGIMQRERPESAIIFCNTKRYTEIVAKRMKLNGYDCEFIMGDLPQAKRLKIIDDIKAGKLRFLVATDVAARGLDIEDLSLVVNYDLPNESENYVHRIGRTARAGKTGKAITFASEQDIYELPSIEKYIGKKIPSETAVEELYAEDKSEGVRIHADFYEDRGGGRDKGRRDGRRDGRKPEGRQSGREHERPRNGERRPGEHKSGEHRPAEHLPGGSTEGRREYPPHAPRERRDNQKAPAAQGGSPAQAAQGGEDISKLSFDERMAFYKNKYDQGKGRKQGQPKSGNQQRGKARPGGGQQQAAQPRAGNQRSNTGKAPRENHKEAPRGTQANPPQQASPEPSQKKGILSKIFGIFKKKN